MATVTVTARNETLASLSSMSRCLADVHENLRSGMGQYNSLKYGLSEVQSDISNKLSRFKTVTKDHMINISQKILINKFLVGPSTYYYLEAI